MPFLPSVSLHLGNCHPFDAESIQCILYLIELKGFDDSLNFFHGSFLIKVPFDPSRSFPIEDSMYRFWRLATVEINTNVSAINCTPFPNAPYNLALGCLLYTSD